MEDKVKTKEQLIEELAALRQQVTELETERKRTVEWFSALTNRSRIGIYIVQNGKIQFVNYVFKNYLGYREEELLGMDHLSLVSPEDRDRVRQNAVKMLKGKHYLPYKCSYMSKSGEMKWVIEAVVAIPYQGKQVTMGSFIDITERKWAEEKYKQLLEDMSDGYAVIQNGKYVFVNRRFSEIFECEPEQILGKPVGQSSSPDAIRAAVEQYGRVIRGEEAVPVPHEVVVNKRGEAKIIIETSVKPIQYEGKPALSVVVRDITEHKRAEKKLQELYQLEIKLRESLEAEKRRKIEFITVLEHELKTPLTPMMASSQLLAEELRDEPFLRLAKNIHESTLNLNKRIDELFDLVRSEVNML